MTRRPSCPACRAAEVIPIAYGFPGPPLMEAADRGQVALGGCVVHDDMPEWRCAECGDEFA